MLTRDDPVKQREYQKRYRDANREKVRASSRAAKARLTPEQRLEAQRRYYAENPEKRKAYADKYRADGRHRAAQIKSRYGLTQDQFNALLVAQGGLCAVCLSNFDGRKMYVDHDHETTAVRGIVHMECNTMMGLAKDNPYLLERAAAYLREHKEKATCKT